jgi:hypothetical protein
MPYDYYMDPDAVEQMINVFNDASNKLQALTSAVNDINSSLEGGALRGRGGNALIAAFSEGLVPGVNALDQRIQDTINELRQAIEDHNEGTGFIRGRFSG